MLFSNATMPTYDPRSVAAVRELPRRRRARAARCRSRVERRAGRAGRRRRSTPCSCASPRIPTCVEHPTSGPTLHAAASPTSSPTAGPARRCRRGASTGGGPKNDQSIQDLVAYLRTIQLTPASKAQQAQAPRTRVDDPTRMPADNVQGRAGHARRRQEDARTRRARRRSKALATPDATDAELDRRRARRSSRRSRTIPRRRRPQAGGRVRRRSSTDAETVDGRPGRARVDA